MKDKEKKHLLRWFLGLMEDRLPIYLFCILISSMGTAFSKIANAWIVESVVSAAQSRNPDGLLIRILIQFRYCSDPSQKALLVTIFYFSKTP